MTVPALRISPAEEHREADEGEPVQQICRIEKLLAEADEDFQPAGSIGPEIELCFEESAHPFQEEFEHEEVVADRYAAVAIAPAMPPAQEEPLADSEPLFGAIPPLPEGVCHRRNAAPLQWGGCGSDENFAEVTPSLSRPESEPGWELRRRARCRYGTAEVQTIVRPSPPRVKPWV